MQRLIPNKTKVNVELFRGVTIGDIIVGGIGMIMLVLVVISNLPFKLGFSLFVVGLTALLLIRLDDQPNYIYFLHILSFLGYKRHFGRRRTDAKLLGTETEEPVPSEKKKGRTVKEQSISGSRKERYKEEDELLKSNLVSQEEKDVILNRRREESRAAAQKAAQAKEASVKRQPMSEIIAFTGIRDNCIEYLDGEYYGAVLEIDPVEFRFFSENRRINSIENCFGRILRSLHANYSANIVKLERPIVYDSYLAKEYEKLEALSESYENAVLSEEELKARVEIEYDRINELRAYCDTNKVITPFYYLVLFESDKRQLELQIREAEQQLMTGELTVRRLDDKELAVFLKYSNQIDFDEHDVDKLDPEDYYLWAQPEKVDIRVRRVEVNHIITHNFRVVGYPTLVGDAWLAGVMSIPGTKVVLKCRPMDRAKSIRNIDHSLTELRGQWSATGIDSKRMEIETHISTLQELLTTLQSDTEALLECNIYVTGYDIVATRNNLRLPQPPDSELPAMTEMKKNLRRSWQESGFRLNNMEFDQVQAFIGSQISALDPVAKEGRGIASNTVAACYPWIFSHISDEGGVRLGESDGIPVFIDFFRRDSERVNSNMVIVGKSGSGKSYATKSLLANLAAEDAKIFILDPENEYTELARNLHGQVINVGNAQYGRLNPFHIITALDDDEAGENAPSGSYATHLQFLEEFFRQIMPDCEKDAMEYLNTLVDHMYLTHDITGETDLSKLSAADYPVFDDLYDEILQEFQSSDNPFTRDLLRSLMNYVSKFSTGGRNANIWNGPSTVTTDENFTVFNFQSMLANRNQTIANAQMLLVLKYIDNEIIKNRDYNLRYRTNRKIVVVIDEAHVFIDQKYPVALDFMFQLAKRIRKYNGMQIVITQNIKDFVGSEELARKSTAIINACQYSFIFALAPNDIQDLVLLYEKAGGINENEQEEIVQAPRGQAFTIMSPSSRSTFRVATSEGISEMFEERDYVSRYFTGPQGEQNWEDFVGGSRAAHEAAWALKPHTTALSVPEEENRYGSGVTLQVYEEDEYPEETGGVGFRVQDEEETDDFWNIPEEETPAQPSAKDRVRDRSEIALDGAGRNPANDPESLNVFSMIASALGRMADAAERGGTEIPAVSPASYQVAPPIAADAPADARELQMKAREAELLRMQQELDEKLRALKEENEKLRAGLYVPETSAVQPEEESFDEEDAGLPDDDEYGREEEGELSALFGDESILFGSDGSDEDEDDEDEEGDEGGSFGEDSEEGSFEDEDISDEEEEEEEGDDDFMASFCSFAESLMKMSPFEKMQANGNTVSEITLEDLNREISARQERQRKNRAGGSF